MTTIPASICGKHTRFLGAATQLRETNGIWLFFAETAHEFTLGLLRSSLPEYELQALMREGAAWSTERAFAEALRV